MLFEPTKKQTLQEKSRYKKELNKLFFLAMPELFNKKNKKSLTACLLLSRALKKRYLLLLRSQAYKRLGPHLN